MSNAEREELAIDMERLLVGFLKAKGVLVNGSMLNTVERFASVIADVATLKEFAK